MNTTTVKPKRKKRVKSNYFSEKEMINLVREYQLYCDDESFSKIAPSILELINGMINKQFSYNHHILNNRNDAIAECFIAIINSLQRYDPNRGRLFAYLNRITKNTLMKYYVRSRKVKDKEKSYTDIISGINEDNIDDDNVIMSFGIKSVNTYVDDSYDLDYNLRIYPQCKNVRLKVDDTVNIIHKYLYDLKDVIFYFVDNDSAVNKLVEDIKASPYVEFEFNYNKVLISDEMFYSVLINNLYEFINNIILYTEKKYENYIYKSENDIIYDGQWSNRAIGYIRRIVKSKLKKDNLARYYNIDDLTNFIKYLIIKRYEYDE